MLSILIPVYNYDITELVKVLLLQLEPLQIPYELIAIDDASTNPETHSKNLEINTYNHCKLLTNTYNLGRTKTRLNLANKATFDWLLFLDADVLPKNYDFIENLVKYMQSSVDMIVGGIAYDTTKPNEKYILRWLYGHQMEAKSIYDRKKKPYSSVVSGNFMIKKNLFIKVSEEIKENKYGMDIIFSYLLKKEQIAILHIDNPVIHLGLEDHISFIKKSLDSVETTTHLQKSNKIPSDFRPLQKSYLFLKKMRCILPVYYLLSLFEKKILANLTSKKPSLFLFNLYRLHHFIKIQKK